MTTRSMVFGGTNGAVAPRDPRARSLLGLSGAAQAAHCVERESTVQWDFRFFGPALWLTP